MFFSWFKKKRTRKAVDAGTVSGCGPLRRRMEWDNRQWVCAYGAPHEVFMCKDCKLAYCLIDARGCVVEGLANR